MSVREGHRPNLVMMSLPCHKTACQSWQPGCIETRSFKIFYIWYHSWHFATNIQTVELHLHIMN